jgi:hypothetical protein
MTTRANRNSEDSEAKMVALRDPERILLKAGERPKQGTPPFAGHQD